LHTHVAEENEKYFHHLHGRLKAAEDFAWLSLPVAQRT
jgi:hypothetical protein